MRKILEPETLDLGGGFEILHGVAGEDVSLIGTKDELQDLAGLVRELDLFEIDREGVLLRRSQSREGFQSI